MHLVDFIIRIYHDAQSPEHQILNKFRCYNNFVTVLGASREAGSTALFTADSSFFEPI